MPSSSSQRAPLRARVLLSLLVTLVFVMPFTEQVSTFDGFLRGGEDLELSLLCALTLLGLLLLLAQKTSTASATLTPTRRLECITNPHPLSRSLVTPQSITPLSQARIVPQPLRI